MKIITVMGHAHLVKSMAVYIGGMIAVYIYMDNLTLVVS